MLKSVSNPKFLLACLADSPAENQARQLAQFLYGTLQSIQKWIKTERNGGAVNLDFQSVRRSSQLVRRD